jgi:hypothetical protein
MKTVIESSPKVCFKQKHDGVLDKETGQWIMSRNISFVRLTQVTGGAVNDPCSTHTPETSAKFTRAGSYVFF